MKSSVLQGKKVVLTGTFVTLKRADAEELLREAGATVSGSISKSTDMLICGADAGSKLAKATSLGVAIMSESDLVALLLQSGVGAQKLAGTAGKLAEAQAQAKAESPIASAVAELRVFVETLKRRADVSIEIAEVGRKATKAEIASLRQQKVIPDELIDLYTAMNGVHVEWQFIEPPGGGCIRIPPVTAWTRFTGEDQHYMGFADGHEALLLDEIRAEGGTWLVRHKKTGKVQIVFASAAEGSDGIEPASTIAAYLRSAMSHGFVYYWPRCFKENKYVSYADQEAAVERFRARPQEPTSIRVGARVHFEYFSEGGRGEVLALHEAPASRAAEFSGRKLVQVKLDEGSTAWLPAKWMKAQTKTDAYERLRDPGFDLAAAGRSALLGLLTDLARAVGPLEHFSTGNFGMYPSNARRAAGLLSTRPLAEAIAVVVDLYTATRKAKLDLRENRALERSGDEFTSTDFARFGFKYSLDSMFVGLFGGLVILACHASARQRAPGRALVDAALTARLAGLSLRSRCWRP